MGMPPRFVGRGYMIDSNRANARGGLETMNQLQRWAADEVIELMMSEPARGEIARGGSDAPARRVDGQIFTMSLYTSADESRAKGLVERILFPDGAKNENERNDVEIVFHSWKYKRTLITNDGSSGRQSGGILGNRERLREALGIRILTDEEAVAEVRERIKARDELARWWHQQEGQPLPPWVGED